MEHEFIIQTPQGAAKLSVPGEEMKVCPCGCDLFRMSSRITWIKPQGVLGAKPLCLRVEVFLCEQCGKEVTPDTHSKRQVAVQANGIVQR